MHEITTILTCLHPFLDRSTYRQLLVVSQSLLAMTGRVAMLGISRWAEQGGSYRTVQRFFAEKICWPLLNLSIMKASFGNSSSVVLIAGDATTVTKSGKKTFGLGRFFSSIYSRPVPGVAFQSLSLLNVEKKKSWSILTEQILSEPEQEQGSSQKKKTKRGRGRPEGSKNTNRRDVELNAEMTQVQKMLRQLLELVGNTFHLAYFVCDGAFGNNAAVQMTRQVGLHLISKLRCVPLCTSNGKEFIPAKAHEEFTVIRLITKNFPQTILNRKQQKVAFVPASINLRRDIRSSRML